VRRVVEGRRVLLASDFDGTLSGIVAVPDEAVMTADMRAAFDAVASNPRVTAAVVSGRRLADVRERVGPAAAFVGGLHGLEIDGPGVVYRHEALARVAGLVGEVAGEAARAMAWCPGLFLEHKEYAITCHVRRVPEPLRARALDEFRAIARPRIDGGGLRELDGAMTIELLPDVDWHKGRAVEWIRAEVAARTGEPPAVVFLGDDRTDEDAFAALGAGDRRLGVGPRPPASLIDWRIADPAAVQRFLQLLDLSAA
jgi:trehalose-phosphatase